MPTDKKNTNKKMMNGKEPVFLVKPIVRGHGLDYLHLTLAALVVILIVLAFALSFSKPAVILKCSQIVNNQTCVNSTTTPQTYSYNALHTKSQVLSAAESALPYYQTLNTSLSLLPYYSIVNKANISYVPSDREWIVVIPYLDPYNNAVYNTSMTLYDSNLSVAGAYLQSVRPVESSSESVTALGAIALTDKTTCTTSNGVVPVYLITDPYAPGAIPSLYSAVNASREFGGKLNLTYYFIFSSYAISKYAGFGQAQTQEIGRYTFCASKQPSKFGDFLSNMSTAFTGEPLSNQTLFDVATGSSLNMASMQSCLTNSSQALDYQSQLASSYNIVATPQFVVDCKYLSIPQTVDYAINYSLGGDR